MARSPDTSSTDAETLSAAEFLELQLKERGLDQIQLAEMTGVSRQTVNAIVRGRQPISRAMSAKLGALFGQSADFWLREQFRRASRQLGEDAADKDGAAPVAPDSESTARRSKILTDEEILEAVHDGTVSIDPFDAAQVNAASLDLRLGHIDAPDARGPADGQNGAAIEIAPLQCTHAWSRETIRLPDTMLARVGPMARLSHLGLFLGHGLQVDPGFEGKLAFSLFNASPNPIVLKAGDAILSLELVQLGSPSRRPIDAARATGDFARRAAAQFTAGVTFRRVEQHLFEHLETVDLDAGRAYVSRIRGTEIEAESDDRETSRSTCMETCFRIIRDEAESEIRRRTRGGRWPELERILGELKLEADDFAILLGEVEVVDRDTGSATIERPDRRRLTIPYPGPSISVRVRQLTGPMHFDLSAFVLVQYLTTNGRGLSLFPGLT